MTEPFKTCSCGKIWEDREAFLDDPHINLVGYMAHFVQLKLGIFIFQHDAPHCGTSLGLQVAQFEDLHNGEVFRENKMGTSACPGYCLHKKELRACPEACECAWVRDVIQEIKQRSLAETQSE